MSGVVDGRLLPEETRRRMAAVAFEESDFDPPRPDDRLIALSALHEGQRLKAGEEREPDRDRHCMGYANGCLCKACSLPAGQRRLRRRLGISIDGKEAA